MQIKLTYKENLSSCRPIYEIIKRKLIKRGNLCIYLICELTEGKQKRKIGKSWKEDSI